MPPLQGLGLEQFMLLWRDLLVSLENEMIFSLIH